MNKTVILLLVLILLAHNTFCQYSVELDGWDGSFSRFEWYVADEQLIGTVVYNRENLNVGWIAVGISDYTGWGMGNADILLVWKQGDNYQCSYRHSYSSGIPQMEVEANFENFSVQIINQKLVLHFVKKLSYPNIANSIDISNRNMAIMVAYNDRETPVDLNNFAKHNWATKRYINFFTDILVEQSKVITPKQSNYYSDDTTQNSISSTEPTLSDQSTSEHISISASLHQSVMDSETNIFKSIATLSSQEDSSATISSLLITLTIISTIIQLLIINTLY